MFTGILPSFQHTVNGLNQFHGGESCFAGQKCRTGVSYGWILGSRREKVG